MNKIKEYFNREFIIALVIFCIIIFNNIVFYKAIIFMLEFIVIMEVVKMIFDFLKKSKIRLRFIIDIFIIFLIRDVVILTTHKEKDYEEIGFTLFVIFIFFIFRILAIYYSPSIRKNNHEKNTDR